MAVVSAPDADALGARAEAMIAELSAISAEPARLMRLFLSPEHRRAADLVTRWMTAAGLSVSEDALGTVRGCFGSAKRRLLIGSHIDTVIDAGKYDGPLGVVAGVLAAEHFARAGAELPFGIDVLAFGDEESSRFPTTLSSSMACAGAFNPEMLALVDAKGISFADALKAYGKKAEDIAAAAYRRDEALAYVEVHIEQGPVLESRNQPLGVVSGIIGQTFFRVDIAGVAGHAGTVPMPLRRDALAGAAEVVLLAERIAKATSGEVVATVGRLNAAPGATNVIPGRVVLTVDMRSGNDAARVAFVAKFKAGCSEIAERRTLELTITPTHEVAATPCDPRLQDTLADAIEAVGGEPHRLGSGAGHDGQAMVKLCPIGMLFVRCRGGISHNPLEYASPRDMGLATAALIKFIERFTP
jgi:allantoate deiminase